jgi:hypothetical protein
MATNCYSCVRELHILAKLLPKSKPSGRSVHTLSVRRTYIEQPGATKPLADCCHGRRMALDVMVKNDTPYVL